MMGIEAFADGALAILLEKPLQLIGSESRIDFALTDINADVSGVAACDHGVEIGRQLDRHPNCLVDDLLSVIGGCRRYTYVRECMQGDQNMRRVFSPSDHDRD